MLIGYDGPERRKRRVYVTHNTEYHLYEDLCVAVRDRFTGEFDRAHLAIGQKLEGALAQGGGMSGFHVLPELGDSMLFQAGRREVITSPVERVTRPPQQVVQSYPAH